MTNYDKIRNELDFETYIELLDEIKNESLIVFAVNDAIAVAWQNKYFFHHPKEIFDKIQSLGFNCNLYGSFRKSYIGILDNGKVVFEKIPNDTTEVVKYNDENIYVESRGFDVRRHCEIRINEIDFSINKTGLNIVVYDKQKKRIIDSVAANFLKEQIVMSRSRLPNDYRFQIEFLRGAGGSVAGYCVDILKIKNCKVFVDFNKRWDFVYEIAQFIFHNMQMVSGFYSDREFDFRFDNYRTIHFNKYDTETDFIEGGGIVVLGDYPIDLRNNKAQIIDLAQLIPEMKRYVFFERFLNEFRSANPDVALVSINFPFFPKSDLSTNEQTIVKGKQNNDWYNSVILNYKDLGYNEKDTQKMFARPKSSVTQNDSYYFEDFDNGFITVRDGHRITPAQPKAAKRKIFFMGECFLFGYGADDKSTMEAFLQELINNKHDEEISVENYGMFCWNVGDNSYKKLFDLPVSSGDIVITNIIGKPKFGNWYNLDLSELFQRPHDYGDNLFIDTLLHYTPVGNKVISEKIFDYLKENNFFKDHHKKVCAPSIIHRFGIPDFYNNNSFRLSSDIDGIDDYKNDLLKEKEHIGCIVMNCNPFTNGHRYLIEKAAGDVLFLYIFVVEEDKSYFRFKDRLELVKKGTADLKNVKVIPSGQFIISQTTFKEYFGKSELQHKTIDPSNDVKIFAEHIAPTLGISKRFAGEEPLDMVTKQYNDSMRKILPQYGIEFVEIPRVKSGDSVISASRVRKMLEIGDFDGIKNIVPETTYEFLVNMSINIGK